MLEDKRQLPTVAPMPAFPSVFREERLAVTRVTGR